MVQKEVSAMLTLSQAGLGLDGSKQVRAAKGKMLTVDHNAQSMQEAEAGNLSGLSQTLQEGLGC